jgi:two-component system, NtrC family, sensor kinase
MDATILVVDDEAAIRKMLKTYLTDAGYKCVTSKDIPSAKQELATQHIDLLISDLCLPGKESGLDLIRYAKDNYPNTGRVMITGFGSREIASEIMTVGVYGYIIKPLTRNVALITVENSLRHLHLDLHMQASKVELEQQISRRTEKLSTIMNNLQAGIVMVNTDMQVIEANRKMLKWFPDVSAGHKTCCYQVIFDKEQQCDDCPMIETLQTGQTNEIKRTCMTSEGIKEFRIVTTSVQDESGKNYAGIAFYDDITESTAMEKELRQAQKLEAVGQLAAGIAHEINTPVQYIGDNLSFLQESYDDIAKVLQTYERLWQKLVENGSVSKEMQQEIEQEIENADLEYLFEEVPNSFKQSLGGVQKVNKIVRAMKDFSHPGNEEKTLNDINTILENTITVCRNEWKYVAEMKPDLDPDLQPLLCYGNEIGQVFLNIIVNGAHAINDFTEGGRNGLGTISVATKQLKDAVQIRISDTGGGIPEEIQERVFETFFTTKERGKGTGQGLAIARRVVTDMHHGKIFFEAKENHGTTFIIELPVKQENERVN